MKLLLWNVNGYRSILGKGLEELIKTESPDILCLQETKVQEEQLPQDHFPVAGYTGAFSSAVKKGYSGVATFAKENLGLMTRGSEIGVKAFDSEGRFIITETKDILLYNVYFPSGTSGDDRQKFKYKFLDAFLEHLNNLSSKDKKRLIVAGDFNICHKPIDIHHPDKASKLELTGFLPDERKWMDKFCESGFVDTFRLLHPDKAAAYSWWSFRANSRAKNLGWRIDYFFVHENLKNQVKQAEILNQVKGSDHCPISLVLS